MKLVKVVLGLTLFLLLPTLSRADALYTYSLNLPSSFPSLGPSSVNWTLDEPSILTSSITIPASSLRTDSVGGVLASNGCSISSVAIFSPTTAGAITTFFSGCSTPGLLTIFSGPITTFGAFTATDATLGITSTPEPGNLVLLGLGLLALIGVARLRPRQQ
jgi:hypothetical protein